MRQILLPVDIRDAKSDDFLGRVTEHATNFWICVQELPGLRVRNQNAVERTLEDRAQPFLRLAQQGLRALALGDDVKYRDKMSLFGTVDRDREPVA